MALRFMESFDFWGTGRIAELYDGWSNNARVTIAGTDRHSTATGNMRFQATSGGSGGNGWVGKSIGGTATTIIVGFALNLQTNDSGTIELLSLDEGVGGTPHVSLRATTGTSTFTLSAGRGNYTELGSAVAAILDSIWAYVEIKAVIHDTAGSIVVKVNGVTVINVSGVDTRNGGTPKVDAILFGNGRGNNSNYDFYIDDIYVLDDSGSLNNDFLGDVRVACIRPDGAGNSTQWTPSAGSNWQNVDDEEPNDDTDYNSEGTAGDKDLYTLTALPTSAGSVAGIREITRHRKDDAGAATIRQLIRTGSTDYEGSDVVVGDNYTYAQAIRETNPNTSAAWTESEINGLEAGVKRQA